MVVAAERVAVYIGCDFIDVICDVTLKTSQPAFSGYIRRAIGRGVIFKDLRLNGRIRQIVRLHFHNNVRVTIR